MVSDPFEADRLAALGELAVTHVTNPEYGFTGAVDGEPTLR